MSGTVFSNNSARAVAAVLFAFSALATKAAAQDAVAYHSNGFELRPYVGAYIPTGDQRDFLKRCRSRRGASVVPVEPQLRRHRHPRLVAEQGPNSLRATRSSTCGSTTWAPSYARRRGSQSGALDFTPYVGLGAGARTYNYRDLDVDSKTNFAGYGALGGELGFGPFGFRLEARDYVSQFKPFDGGDSKTRNDVTVATGLTLRF